MPGISRLAEIERQILARKRSGGRLDSKLEPTNGIDSIGGIKMFYVKFIVRKHERALLFRDGDFVKFLEPGVYRRITLTHRYTIERADLSAPLFEHRLTDFLVEIYKDDVERYFNIVSTGADEIVVVYHNDRVSAVLGPAERKLFAKGVQHIRVERFEVVDNLDVDTRPASRR